MNGGCYVLSYQAACSQIQTPDRLFLGVVAAFSDIELIHGRLRPTVNQHLEGIHGALETGFDDLHLLLRDSFQDVVRGVLTRRRTPDADFDSDELGGSQCVDHRLNAVVTAMPSCLLDAQAARLEIQIVMHENEIIRGELVLAEKTLERRARHIHEIERPGQFDQLGAVANGRSLSRASPDKTTRPSCRRPFHNPDAGVVTGLGIGRARVAQSYDEAQRYFFFSASFFSAFGAAAAAAPSFFSPALASAPAAGAAAAAPGAAATSAPSAAALPLTATSGSFAPSGPAAWLVSSASSLASDIGTATLTTI